jgi:hypothetical protein
VIEHAHPDVVGVNLRCAFTTRDGKKSFLVKIRRVIVVVARFRERFFPSIIVASSVAFKKQVHVVKEECIAVELKDL